MIFILIILLLLLLSPLLFIVAIDPLLTHLEVLQEVDERCFADDLGVGFEDCRMLGPVVELIDFWSEAAGPQVSHKQTNIMTTDERCPELSQVLPASWEGVEYTDRYKYLGVMISSDRNFGVAEVFGGDKKVQRKGEQHDEDEEPLQPRNEGGDGEHIPHPYRRLSARSDAIIHYG